MRALLKSMLIATKALLIIGTTVCFCIACVSVPETAPASGTQDAPAPSSSVSAGEASAKSAATPEISPSADITVKESAPVLSEAPQIFPEASLVPVIPKTLNKNVIAPLPSPAAPAVSSADKTAQEPPTTASGAKTQEKTAATTATGQTGTAASATAQKSTTGSSTQPEKKSQPVDPQTLKAPEPKTETTVVKEPVPVPAAGIPELPSKTNPALVEETVVLSRSVRAAVGQLVEIPYQGAGWVYLGETGGKKGLAYDSRRLDPDGQTFVFRCEAPGTYVVKFFKQDFIKDFIINDYVEVVVGESPLPSAASSGMFTLPVDRGRVVANPRWPVATNVASAQTGSAAAPAAAVPTSVNAQTANTAAASTPQTATTSAATTPATTPAAAANSTPASTTPATSTTAAAPAATTAAVTNPSLESLSQPEEFIDRAQSEYRSGKFTDALATLQAFTSKYPAGSDEAWWLLGQVLEAKGPQRDIKSALSYYKRLLAEYPQSQRYQEAQQRIAYLERFYFDIR